MGVDILTVPKHHAPTYYSTRKLFTIMSSNPFVEENNYTVKTLWILVVRKEQKPLAVGLGGDSRKEKRIS